MHGGAKCKAVGESIKLCAKLGVKINCADINAARTYLYRNPRAGDFIDLDLKHIDASRALKLLLQRFKGPL